MNYFEFSDDERQVWRGDPVTHAFRALLEERLADVTEDALGALMNHSEKDAFIFAGRNNAFGETLDLMKRDK